MASKFVVSWIIRAKDDFSKVSAKVAQSMKDLEAKAKQLSDKIGNAGKMFKETGKTLRNNVTLPLLAFGGLSVAAAAKVERLGVSLEVMTGSAAKSKKVMGDLLKLAKDAPFVFDELGQSAKVLLGTKKFKAEDVVGEVKKIGDVAAIYNADLESISNLYAGVINNNKLMGGDIAQLQQYGIPAISLLQEILKEKLDQTFSERKIMEFASEGVLPSGALRMMFDRLTKEGGTAFNGMAKATNTLSGAFTKFKDTMFLTSANFGQTIADTINLKQNVQLLGDKLHHASERFATFAQENPAMASMIVKLGLIAAALGPIALALGTIIKMIAIFRVATLALMGPWGLVALAITGVVVAIMKLKGQFDSLKSSGLSTGEAIAGSMSKVLKPIFNAIPGMGPLANAIDAYTEGKARINNQRTGSQQLQGINAQQAAATNGVQASVDININDKNKNVKSVNATNFGFSPLNLGINNFTAWVTGNA